MLRFNLKPVEFFCSKMLVNSFSLLLSDDLRRWNNVSVSLTPTVKKAVP